MNKCNFGMAYQSNGDAGFNPYRGRIFAIRKQYYCDNKRRNCRSIAITPLRQPIRPRFRKTDARQNGSESRTWIFGAQDDCRGPLGAPELREREADT